MSIERSRYAAMFGPTVGDRVRLADTDLWITPEHDACAAGDEVVFGGGKVIRESMGQGLTTSAQGAPDTVITNALVLDHSGVFKADMACAAGGSRRWARRGIPTRWTACTRR